jgi:hypothetical protein
MAKDKSPRGLSHRKATPSRFLQARVYLTGKVTREKNIPGTI